MVKFLKIDGYGRTIAGDIRLDKQTYTIANDTSKVGAIPFGTIDNIYGVLAFVNGIESNITYDAYANVSSTIDILADTTSANYPTTINLYWNGSSCNGGTSSSLLGNLETNDIIRIYYIN
jgi:hypothetical protein